MTKLLIQVATDPSYLHLYSPHGRSTKLRGKILASSSFCRFENAITLKTLKIPSFSNLKDGKRPIKEKNSLNECFHP